jgi:hypothetical protein
MEGEWRVHRPGERWRRPGWQARVVIETPAAVAVGFDLGVVEVFPASEEADRLDYLGPDLLGLLFYRFILNRTSTKFFAQSADVVNSTLSERGMLFKSTS